MGNGALNGVEVFADFAADGNAEEAMFKRGAEAWEELGFE
jgi:hypothetical protein